MRSSAAERGLGKDPPPERRRESKRVLVNSNSAADSIGDLLCPARPIFRQDAGRFDINYLCKSGKSLCVMRGVVLYWERKRGGASYGLDSLHAPLL